MKAVIQRVQWAQVEVEGKLVSRIEQGLLTLLGFDKGDTEESLEKLIQKISTLRVFSDENGKMNRSLLDIQGAHLLVSQFTLSGDCNTGRRPSFSMAESPERAKVLYEKALEMSQKIGLLTKGGIFQADMRVSLLNDGPVTFIL